jgi:hypothetical protein
VFIFLYFSYALRNLDCVSAVLKFNLQFHIVLFLISCLQISELDVSLSDRVTRFTQAGFIRNTIVTARITSRHSSWCGEIFENEKNHWKRILTQMVDTRVNAYPDQYYFTRPDTTSYKYQLCIIPLCKESLPHFTCLLKLNHTFLSQSQSNVSSRLYNKKHLQHSSQCIKTDGNSIPRTRAIKQYRWYEKCNRLLFEKSECCQIIFMIWHFRFIFCK